MGVYIRDGLVIKKTLQVEMFNPHNNNAFIFKLFFLFVNKLTYTIFENTYTYCFWYFCHVSKKDHSY